MKRTGVIVVLFMILLSGYLAADNISEKIRLNGFLSQGFVYTTDNSLIPRSNKNGSFEMSEAGITFSVDISEKLHFGFQLLARDMGPHGNHQVKLDWGYADYHLSDGFGIRVGRIKSPLGFYNETRDTDALHPMALLPQSVYDEFMRPVFVSYNGIGLYGNLGMGPVGSIDYHLFYGTVHHPNDAPYMMQIQTAINLAVNPMGLNMSDINMDTEIFYGGRAIWNFPFGLRVGGTYVYLNTDIDSMIQNLAPEANMLPAGLLPSQAGMEITNCFFLSAEWVIGNLTVVSEYMELLPYITFGLFDSEDMVSDENMQGWYVLASYVLGDKWSVNFLYDRFYEVKGDTAGENAVSEGNQDFYGWQKDIAFGLRFDANFNWTIKLEWHVVDGIAKSFTYTDPETAAQKWNMLVAKMSFNF